MIILKAYILYLAYADFIYFRVWKGTSQILPSWQTRIMRLLVFLLYKKMGAENWVLAQWHEFRLLNAPTGVRIPIGSPLTRWGLERCWAGFNNLNSSHWTSTQFWLVLLLYDCIICIWKNQSILQARDLHCNYDIDVQTPKSQGINKREFHICSTVNSWYALFISLYMVKSSVTENINILNTWILHQCP